PYRTIGEEPIAPAWMRTPKMVRVTVIVVARTVVLREEASAKSPRVVPRRRIDGIGVPHSQRGIKGTPGPPTPEEIRRRRAFPYQHGRTRAIGNIRDTGPRVLVDHAIAFRSARSDARVT